MKQETWARRKSRIWESMAGCDCDPSLGRHERCNKSVVRCNGRVRVIQDKLAELGPCPSAVAVPKRSIAENSK